MIIRDLEKIDSRRYLSRIRLKNEMEHQERVLAINEKLPRIQELDNEIITLSMQEYRKRKNRETQSSGDYASKIKALSDEKRRILIENNYPADYLDPIYTCKKCQDWGEINGQVCSCVKELRINELYQRSNLSNLLEVENFETFSFDYYSNEPYPGMEMTPYENMKNIYAKSKRFVQDFDRSDDNILIYGGPGLGKTFLSNCIAKELLDSGHRVLYLSSNELFSEVLSSYLMSKNEADKETLKPIYEYLYSSDLLIIDDLGTEVVNSFVRSQFFEIINKRILTKRSTLISTNLSLGELQETYNQRVISRIVDKYTLFPVYGSDIRKVRKINTY